MTCLLGVWYLAVVKRTADPSGNCSTFCTEPFPKVVSPTRTARRKSLSAPATISAPLALPSFTSNTIGKFGRGLLTAKGELTSFLYWTRACVEKDFLLGGKN